MTFKGGTSGADKEAEKRMIDFQDPEIYRTVLEGLPIGLYLVDCDRKILFWNDAAERITGYLKQDVVGRHCRDNILMHCDDKNNALCASACPLLETMVDGGAREAELFLRHQAGHRVPVWVQAVPLRDRSGAIVGAVESFKERGSHTDLERRQSVMERGRTEWHERGERRLVGTRLAESLVLFSEHRVPFSALLFQLEDVDEFQATYGLPATEAILQVVARCLESNLRATDFVGPWNARQFLAVLPGCETGVENAGKRLSRLGSLSCIRWWGDPISIRVAWGGATAQAGDTAESIVQRAGRALEASPTNQPRLVLERGK